MTVRRCARFLLIVALLAAPAVVAAQRRGPGPLRIVLLVDSSNAVAPMLPQFRAAINTFLDVLPGDPEIAFISTGGQLRVRVPPTVDRLVLHQAADRFASDGGANAFLDTMLEADQRFLKVSPNRRSVFVIITTDSGDLRGEVRIDQYNRFMKDFTDRGGRAHGIVVRGVNAGSTTDILMNLTSNTNGFYDSLTIANALADRMKALAEIVALDMP